MKNKKDYIFCSQKCRMRAKVCIHMLLRAYEQLIGYPPEEQHYEVCMILFLKTNMA